MVEKTFPAPPQAPQAPQPPLPAAGKTSNAWLKPAVIGVLAVAGLAAALGGTYWFGYSRGQAVQAKTNLSQQPAPLQVPKGATIISQCSKGRGEQYVLPANIPHGPVFNVFNGKVIGIEYMISPTDLASDMTFFNLPTYGQKFDHLDVGLLSQGHTGYPVPHYHVDMYTVSRAFSQSITCK